MTLPSEGNRGIFPVSRRCTGADPLPSPNSSSCHTVLNATRALVHYNIMQLCSDLQVADDDSPELGVSRVLEDRSAGMGC